MVDYIKGIDISVIQGVIDFVAVKNSGYSFVICRCGVGNSGIDSNYSHNIASAKVAGLQVAAYHFVFPLPTTPAQPLRDPVKQAQYHFNAAQGALACIDCEWPASQDFSKWNVTPDTIKTWLLAYLTEYQRLDNGRVPVIYTYPYWAEAVNLDSRFTQYPLWIASYATSTPAIPSAWSSVGWTLWQNSGGSEKLPNGVPVDTDVAKDLSLWNVASVADPLSPVEVAPMPAVAVVTPVAPVASTSVWSSIFGVFSKFFK